MSKDKFIESFISTTKGRTTIKRPCTDWVNGIVLQDMFPAVGITDLNHVADALNISEQVLDEEMFLGNSCSMNFICRVCAYFNADINDTVFMINQFRMMDEMYVSESFFQDLKVINLKAMFPSDTANSAEMSVFIAKAVNVIASHKRFNNNADFDYMKAAESTEISMITVPGEPPLGGDFIEHIPVRIGLEKGFRRYVSDFKTVFDSIEAATDHIADRGPKKFVELFKLGKCSKFANSIALCLLEKGIRTESNESVTV